MAKLVNIDPSTDRCTRDAGPRCRRSAAESGQGDLGKVSGHIERCAHAAQISAPCESKRVQICIVENETQSHRFPGEFAHVGAVFPMDRALHFITECLVGFVD